MRHFAQERENAASLGGWEARGAQGSTLKSNKLLPVREMGPEPCSLSQLLLPLGAGTIGSKLKANLEWQQF